MQIKRIFLRYFCSFSCKIYYVYWLFCLFVCLFCLFVFNTPPTAKVIW